MFYRLEFAVEDTGRVPARVLQTLEHARAKTEQFSFIRHPDRFEFILLIHTDDLYRVESLLWKLHGMLNLTATTSGLSTNSRRDSNSASS